MKFDSQFESCELPIHQLEFMDEIGAISTNLEMRGHSKMASNDIIG